MPGQLLTDWLTIGTAGPTVDGRTIKAEWLTDAAENYDPEEYTAVANAEHWFGNYGSVRQLRTAEDKKGRTVLQARIRPNVNYLQQNSADTRIFFSMELTHDFAKTGKTYLTGLATTDRPASLGTSETHFSRQDDEKVFRGGSEEINVSQFFTSSESDNKNFVSAVIDGIKDLFKSNNHEGEPDMTKEQFEALQAGNKVIQDAFATLNANLEKLTAKTETGKTETGKTEAANTETPKPEADGKADFSKLSENIVKFGEQVKGLADKLDAALTGKNGTDFGKGTGSTEEQSFV